MYVCVLTFLKVAANNICFNLEKKVFAFTDLLFSSRLFYLHFEPVLIVLCQQRFRNEKLLRGVDGVLFSAHVHLSTAALLCLAGLKVLSWWILKANLDGLISGTASGRFHLVSRVWLPKPWVVQHSLFY